MRLGQSLGRGSLRSAGMARMEASGLGEARGYGKSRNESKLAVLGLHRKNR